MTKTLTFLFCILTLTSIGQINPDCTTSGMHSIYVLTDSNLIYRIDNVNAIPSSPVFIDSIPAAPEETYGLTISNNFNGGTYSPTLYTTIQNKFFYNDSIGWINTGDSTSLYKGNLGGGINHLYHFSPTDNDVYNYNGNGNATLFASSVTFIGVSVLDIATDSLDNFYIINTLVGPNFSMYKYNNNGIRIDTIQVTGLTMGLMPSGFTMIDNTFYLVDDAFIDNPLKRGTIVGNTLAFTQIGTIDVGSDYVKDIAACPYYLNTMAVSEHTNEDLFSISPNPTSDVLKITTTNFNSKQSIQILSYTGQILYDNSDYTGQPIQTRHLTNGVYLLKYSDSKSFSIKRFIVQH